METFSLIFEVFVMNQHLLFLADSVRYIFVATFRKAIQKMWQQNAIGKFQVH